MEKRKYYPVLDLVKFIAAIVVMLFHCFPHGTEAPSVPESNPIPLWLGESAFHVISRICVPLFFVISAFLLFKKIDEDIDNKWKYIGKFCIRILYLFLFWFIASLPQTIKTLVDNSVSQDWYHLVQYIILTVFKGSRGFWYLVALVLCVLITAIISDKKSMITIIIIASILYVFGCLNTTYFGIFSLSNDPISNAFKWTGEFFELHICIFEGLIYVVMGRLFAKYGQAKIKLNILFIAIAYILGVGEVFLTLYTNLFHMPDAFFMLPLFVFLIFNFLLGLDSKNEKFIKVTKKLRKVGSFLYLFHFQFFFYFYWAFDASNNNPFVNNYALVAIPFVICIALGFLLQTLFEYLSKYKYLHFLKYSY